MAWTEIIRRQYRSDEFRYASDFSDAELVLIGARHTNAITA
jgi:hypothetical protein